MKETKGIQVKDVYRKQTKGLREIYRKMYNALIFRPINKTSLK